MPNFHPKSERWMTIYAAFYKSQASRKGRESISRGRSLRDSSRSGGAVTVGCARARDGAELSGVARVCAHVRGGAESGARRGCRVGRGRCAPTPRSACPWVPSAAVRLEQPPKSAWRHFEAKRRRNGRAGCGRGGGGGGDWMRRRRRIPETSGVRGVGSRAPGGRKQFS